MIIERATTDDAAAILLLQRLAYQSEAVLYQDDTIPPLRETLDELRAIFVDHLVLKAVEDTTIVGAVRARVQQEAVLIGRLLVAPQRQGRGIGTQLLQAVERCYPQATRFELFTGHRSTRNLALYQRLGYHETRREAVHPGLTMVFLEKRRPSAGEMRAE